MIEFLLPGLNKFVESHNSNMSIPDEDKFNITILSDQKDILTKDAKLFAGNNIFLHTLSSAISAPLIFRNTHYKNVYDNETSKWIKLLDKILFEGERIIKDLRGKEFAEEWFYTRKNYAINLVRIGKFNSILVGVENYSLTKLTKGTDEGVASWIDNLYLNLGGEDRILIGKRKIRSKSELQDSRIGGFREVKDDFHRLLKLIEDFDSSSMSFFFKTHHHLFYRCDDEVTGDKQFFSEMVDYYLRDIKSTTHSAYIALVADLSLQSDRKLRQTEILAMQRVNYDDCWIIASKSVDFSNRREELINLLDDYKLDISMINNYAQLAKQESDKGPQKEYVAIFLKCDVNSWIGSREIDGEQVMTDN